MAAKKRARSTTTASAQPRTTGWIVSRVLLAALGLAALSFALQGGEYGTTDLFSQKRRLARAQAEVDSLQRRVDSLAAYKQLVETDPATQERIAREEFGMVRPGEILYRFADP